MNSDYEIRTAQEFFLENLQDAGEGHGKSNTQNEFQAGLSWINLANFLRSRWKKILVTPPLSFYSLALLVFDVIEHPIQNRNHAHKT